jgi:hypothetical protein
VRSDLSPLACAPAGRLGRAPAELTPLHGQVTSPETTAINRITLQHPVPAGLLTRIGDITVSFALLENAIQTLVGSLVKEHQRISQIITAELAFRNLRALAVSLYRERHGEDADFEVLRALMRRAGYLEEQRNQITHSIWAAGDSADTVTRIKTTAKEQRGLHFDWTRVGEEDLAAVAEAMKLLAGEIQAFWIHQREAGK